MYQSSEINVCCQSTVNGLHPSVPPFMEGTLIQWRLPWMEGRGRWLLLFHPFPLHPRNLLQKVEACARTATETAGERGNFWKSLLSSFHSQKPLMDEKTFHGWKDSIRKNPVCYISTIIPHSGLLLYSQSWNRSARRFTTQGDNANVLSTTIQFSISLHASFLSKLINRLPGWWHIVSYLSKQRWAKIQY